MIYVDFDGLPTDWSRDAGDSSMRCGMLSISGKEEYTSRLMLYVTSSGEFVRHPRQAPWDNPKNFSRDQMLPLVAGLSKTEEGRKAVRKNLFNRIKHFFFAQNTERDAKGSTKYPFPHYYYRSSRPSSLTVFKKEELSSIYTIESSKFDFADILLPHYIWHMIVASRTWYLYWLAPVGVTFFLLHLLFHAYSKETWEENQTVAMCYVQGKWAINIFKRLNFSRFIKNNKKYWTDRGEEEYIELIHNIVK